MVLTNHFAASFDQSFGDFSGATTLDGNGMEAVKDEFENRKFCL